MSILYDMPLGVGLLFPCIQLFRIFRIVFQFLVVTFFPNFFSRMAIASGVPFPFARSRTLKISPEVAILPYVCHGLHFQRLFINQFYWLITLNSVPNSRIPAVVQKIV
jgi:hypothetical protein